MHLNKIDDFYIIAGELMDYTGEDEVIEIPRSVTVISSTAFLGNNRIREIIIPSTVILIDTDAFMGCADLEKITFGDSVPYHSITVGSEILMDCPSLKSIVVNAELERKDLYYFDHDTETHPFGRISSDEKLKLKLTVSGYVTTIPKGIFSSMWVDEVIIEDGVQVIDESAFRYSKIHKITIPSTIHVIEDDAFNGLKCIDEVHYGGNIGEWSNIDFKSVTSVPINSGAHLFMTNTVGDHEELKNVIFPDSVKIINPYAFYKLSHVSTIAFPRFAEIGDKAFVIRSPVKVFIPKGFTDIGFITHNGYILEFFFEYTKRGARKKYAHSQVERLLNKNNMYFGTTIEMFNILNNI